MKISINKVKKETPDCISVVFDIPKELVDKFEFIHGQHLTIIHQTEEGEVRRTYSLCGRPDQGIWQIAIKRVEGGFFSNFANDNFKQGFQVSLLPPIGRFTLSLDSSSVNHYVAFAAGSGITPIISNIKTALHVERKSHITLFYINKRTEDIIFLEGLEDLKNQYIERFTIFHILTREKSLTPEFSGRIDKEKLSFYFKKLIDPEEVAQFLLCGPFGMVTTIENFLIDRGISSRKIAKELFYVPEKVESRISGETAIKQIASEEQGNWTIRFEGNSYSIEAHNWDEPVLDVARKQGINLPYACKGGVCASCKALLVQGDVEMLKNYALVQEELDKGYVLTCQSLPRSDYLELDFDTRS